MQADTESTELKHALSDKDNVIINRSPLSEGIKILLFVVLVVLAVDLSAVFPWSVQSVSLGELFGTELSFGVPFFGIIPLILLGVISHNLLNYRYILTPEYVLEVAGLLDFSSHTARLHYIHIRGIEIDKSLYQRIVGIGDLSIVSAASHGDAEICMKGIATPGKYKDMIEERIKMKEKDLGPKTIASALH